MNASSSSIDRVTAPHQASTSAVCENVHDRILREADLIQAEGLPYEPNKYPALWDLYCRAVLAWEQTPETARKPPTFRYKGRSYAISESFLGRVSVWTADRKRRLVSGSAGRTW